MKKLWAILSLCLFMVLFSSTVHAHVTNEKTLFDDIEFSKAKEQIVYLAGIGVIGYEEGTPLYKPLEKLDKGTLAFYAGKFKRLTSEAGKEEIQQAALQHGLVDSLKGEATYADVNKAFFDGKAPMDNPQGTLTKEEFAIYLGRFLKEPVNGKTLLEMAGLEPGPSGKVEKVNVEEQEGNKSYQLQIGGKVYVLAHHPKVMYVPVDPSQWEGKTIRESWVFANGGEHEESHAGHEEHGEIPRESLQIIVFDSGQFTSEAVASQPTSAQTRNGQDTTFGQNATASAVQGGSFPFIPVIGGLVLLTIIVWLFVRRKMHK
ncbi:MAG: hypothetical protein QJR06_01825 [Alicyclobacillaceae bacterium]|nr:hypothetical protein [Alicyclobacillaceae bacterium]